MRGSILSPLLPPPPPAAVSAALLASSLQPPLAPALHTLPCPALPCPGCRGLRQLYVSPDTTHLVHNLRERCAQLAVRGGEGCARVEVQGDQEGGGGALE